MTILGNLSDFSKQVWIPNKFKSISNLVLFSGFLIQILFLILTLFQKESCSLSYILPEYKIW
jgi:uncharacterized integral membrane protein